MLVYKWQAWPEGRYDEPFPDKYHSPGACLENAWWFAVDHGKLELVRGYAQHPIARAQGRAPVWLGRWWCADEQGRVVDPSWKNEGSIYVGLEVIEPLDVRDAVLGLGNHAGTLRPQVESLVPPPHIKTRLEQIRLGQESASAGETESPA